jgi:hypothetical protein
MRPILAGAKTRLPGDTSGGETGGGVKLRGSDMAAHPGGDEPFKQATVGIYPAPKARRNPLAA